MAQLCVALSTPLIVRSQVCTLVLLTSCVLYPVLHLQQVVFRIIEDTSSQGQDRFRVEVLFSAGADGDPFAFDCSSSKSSGSAGLDIAPLRILSDNVTLAEFQQFLTAAQLTALA